MQAPIILDTDSSQLSAIHDVIWKERHLVIEGPPGTGKSQTIANIITAALARGKTVLFVAEKKPALDVVKSRLDHAGLGGFILELHGHKTRKGNLHGEIKKRLDGTYNHVDRSAKLYDDLVGKRAQLIAYSESVEKKVGPFDEAVHEIFWKVERFRSQIKSKDARLIIENPFTRQQMKKLEGRANLCIADFVAPKESGLKDYLGTFVVTAGIGEDERAKAFEAAHDDYSAILFKSLCDRLAEAFAEHLHLRVRREFWGYASEEALTNDDLIGEKYQGIRPAPGYPACPEHSEKAPLFEVLDATAQIGVKLTENFAMWPGAAVSGFYLSHPDSQYFAVAKIERDQVEDY